jgi:hypothetical protein
MLVFLVLGVSLLFLSIAEALTRPLVSAGSKLQGSPSVESGIGKSFVLGISTGLLWAPCAGPILVILTLAEVVISNPPLAVDEVVGRPVWRLNGSDQLCHTFLRERTMTISKDSNRCVIGAGSRQLTVESCPNVRACQTCHVPIIIVL